MNRRNFIIKTSLSLGALSFLPNIGYSSIMSSSKGFTSKRPMISDRTYHSDAVEDLLSEVKSKIADEELGWMFENCYPNTLDTTVDFEMIDGKEDTFIITGDIDAMWLRDSTAQVWPYMPLIPKDEKIRLLIKGLINRQVKCILKDPYANAFYKDLKKESHWKSDNPNPIPGVHERKWEIDSLCYVIRLSHEYHRISGDASIFDDSWDEAMKLIVKTFRTEQLIDEPSPYRFSRTTNQMIDAPIFNGTGRPVKPVGLIASQFRPSDDATLFPFLIPSNIFAILSLNQLNDIYSNIFNEPEFAKECADFAEEVETAVRKYAILEHLDFGKIYAYEVDGFGNALFMDDANVPSLMSLAYLGAHQPEDALYKRTRQFLLSDNNPYFLKGTVAEGQGSPHTWKEKIWPMGIILRAMTSTDEQEIIHCLQMLKDSHADTGFMHEAFHKDDPADYNRAWFAWANTLFGELIIKVYQERPSVLEMVYK
ncbi:glycoside hydrolase family 125 protein [Lentimicrobium sp. L6]|uniref:glycoside hydrolase family 125 protein n=1 Tax=Lentimicrobium sp. L6 TaxID=2735916 RepID=UPI00155364E7|nr:glycoside hydrolase family 125 protein [Lentimicrobium sp. L6]NPD85199.1 glycoside hydrolase family 125 protein [Lentimicrobium sp. L6]